MFTVSTLKRLADLGGETDRYFWHSNQLLAPPTNQLEFSQKATKSKITVPQHNGLMQEQEQKPGTHVSCLV